MKDEDIDLSEVPELGDGFFEEASLRMPKAVSFAIEVDADVLMWFKSQDAFEKRMNAAPRIYAEAHKH